MGIIKSIRQETRHKFLNFFTMDVEGRDGKEFEYYVASRAREISQVKAVSQDEHPDGVAIYSLYGPKRDRVVLVRQYRYPIGSYVYEFPAGLMEAGESMEESAIREMKEETGLDFKPIQADPVFSKPRYTTVGLTDESCAMVYGFSDGSVSTEGLESTEELEVVIADKDEVRRILREEKAALICSYMLYHFLYAQEGHAFDFLQADEL